jgi:hypothetical protein
MSPTGLSETVHLWLGWCPNKPVIHAAPEVLIVPAGIVQTAGAGGNVGRSEKILSGARIALSGIRILNQNRQLLWYSLMTGIVMAFVFISQYGLQLLSVYPYDAIDLPRRLILTFSIRLASVFCLTVLAAGLVLSLFHKEEGERASFYDGICRARAFLRPLADWTVIMALLGMAMEMFLTGVWIAVIQYTETYISLRPAMGVFPFNFILLPEVYHIGPIGGTFAISTAVTSTLTFSAINAVLFFSTMFVIPLLVLDNRSIPEAVAGSGVLLKKVLCEALGCSFLLIFGISAAATTSMLFPIMYNITAPGMLSIWYPGEAWIAAAVLYLFVLFGLVCIISTIAGIAVTNLYSRDTGTRDRGSPKTGDAITAAEPAF